MIIEINYVEDMISVVGVIVIVFGVAGLFYEYNQNETTKPGSPRSIIRACY